MAILVTTGLSFATFAQERGGLRRLQAAGVDEITHGPEGKYLPSKNAALKELIKNFEKRRPRGFGIHRPSLHSVPHTICVGSDVGNFTDGTGPFTLNVIETILKSESKATTPKIVVVLPRGHVDEFKGNKQFEKLRPFYERKKFSFLELGVGGQHDPGGLEPFKFIRDYFPFIYFDPDKNLYRLISTLHSNALSDPDKKQAYIQAAKDMTEYVAKILRGQGAKIELVEAFDVVLEGGNLLSDGAGTCFTTRKTLELNPPESDALARMKKLFGCERVIVLDSPHNERTVRHVDTILFPRSKSSVLLNLPNERTSLEDFNVFRNNRMRLLKAGYALGEIHRFDRWMSTANALVTGNNVYLPEQRIYLRGREATPEQKRRLAKYNADVLKIFKKSHPTRKIVPYESDFSRATGGGIRCLTGVIPRVSKR